MPPSKGRVRVQRAEKPSAGIPGPGEPAPQLKSMTRRSARRLVAAGQRGSAVQIEVGPVLALPPRAAGRRGGRRHLFPLQGGRAPRRSAHSTRRAASAGRPPVGGLPTLGAAHRRAIRRSPGPRPRTRRMPSSIVARKRYNPPSKVCMRVQRAEKRSAGRPGPGEPAPQLKSRAVAPPGTRSLRTRVGAPIKSALA